MPKVKIGLKLLEMGPIAVDGGMGTVLTPLACTVVDTALLTSEAATVTDFPIEEEDDPYYTSSVAGKKTLTFSSYDMDPASLVRVLGGSATTDASGNNIYEAPSATPVIEQSFRLTDQKGNITEIPRGKVDAIIQQKFQKSGLAQVDVTVTVLKPTKAGVAPYRIISLP
ncbi:hypothetical protein AAHN97_14985 [Chitinophaga niabensis]|uniref:hypothetical protein n=1 Tax=Chitinophaga niabensis TaxID=536979 RepID=UPI0031B9FEEC